MTFAVSYLYLLYYINLVIHCTCLIIFIIKLYIVLFKLIISRDHYILIYKL